VSALEDARWDFSAEPKERGDGRVLAAHRLPPPRLGTYRVLTTDREHDALLDDPAVQQAIFGLPWGNGAFRTKSAAVRGEQRSQARIRETPPVEAQIWIGSSDTEPLSTPFRGVFILPPIAIILGRM
jgi:hypothetical protein